MKSIYLCGGITGLSYDDARYGWRREVALKLHNIVRCLSPMRGMEAFEDQNRINNDQLVRRTPFSLHTGTDRAITGRDRMDLCSSHLVFANLMLTEANEVSIGSMIEFGWADLMRIPVLGVVPKDSAYARHPMVRDILTWNVDTVDEGIEICRSVFKGGL